MSVEEILKQKYFKSYGETYVAQAHVKVKSPVTNVFIDGILYSSYNKHDRNIYVRTVVDFLDQFVPFNLLDTEYNEH